MKFYDLDFGSLHRKEIDAIMAKSEYAVVIPSSSTIMTDYLNSIEGDVPLKSVPNDVVEADSTIDNKPSPSATAKLGWSSLFQVEKSKSKVVIRYNDEIPTAKGYSSSFRPRGLVNRGNICFFNSVLQSLIYCEPFHAALLKYSRSTIKKLDDNGLLEALIRFFKEFSSTPSITQNGRFGDPFSADFVYAALMKVRRFEISKGNQEDAEEFLGFLLDSLHEELIGKDYTADANVNSDAWIEIGKNNKAIKKRSTLVVKSFVTDIFCGKFRSIITNKKTGNNSICIEPFHILPLEATNPLSSLEKSLVNLCATEIIETNGKNEFMEKRIQLEVLPQVLILHLKRFVYNINFGIQKIYHFISYPKILKIPNQCLFEDSTSCEYELFSVVYHHGKSTNGGHYTVAVRWSSKDGGQWLHIDDKSISEYSESHVLNEKSGQAYLLFYKKR